MNFSDTQVPVQAEKARLDALNAYGVLDTPAERNFDDLAHFAAELCDAPVALVSFVAADRQWFKARVGFEPSETALNSSVCRFVLHEPDLLVISDLQTDARTLANPLVTGEPHIRFYAGAPLRTAEGQVLGSLCVIDTAPRPEGLTPRQANNLRRLAQQVVDQLELRRMVGVRDAELARSKAASGVLKLSEAHWRGLFENLQEGFVLGQPVRDDGGRIIDWRYLEVNAAWSGLVGRSREEVLGRTLREILPGIEQEWIDLATVVDTGDSMTFTRQVGQLDRWYDGRASALGPDLFSLLFLEVTDRVRAFKALAASAAQKAALAELGDHLRSARSTSAMSYTASEIVGRTLHAKRAGYGTVNARREEIDVPADWCAAGVASVGGLHSFRAFGSYIDDLKAGRTVVISDVMTDARTAGDGAAALERIGVRALVNSPVIEAGELVSVSFVHFDTIRDISSEEQAFIRAAADRTRVGIARLDAEERQAVLNGEISHRLKNVLSMVQAVASQTLKGRADPEAVSAFDQRLAALSKAQDVLMRAERQAADLGGIIREVLHLAGVHDRCDQDGPEVMVGSRAALSTSLLVHELATNAIKYGALSREQGRVRVNWTIEGGAEGELRLDWREEGGPPASTPTRKGFGSRLLRSGLLGTGGSDVSYGANGLSATFRAPLRQVERA